jgi:hypothetical protein
VSARVGVAARAASRALARPLGVRNKSCERQERERKNRTMDKKTLMLSLRFRCGCDRGVGNALSGGPAASARSHGTADSRRTESYC